MYLTGFGNHHQTEAVAGALPAEQNSPQRCSFDLYAEQLNGSAFTRARHLNLRSWLYRKSPSVVRSDYVLHRKALSIQDTACQPPNPYRWSPLPEPPADTDFIEGLFHVAGNSTNQAFIYQCNQSMQNKYFVNNDGEMLFVSWTGDLILWTEFGQLELKPGHIAVIPRGVIFKVEVKSSWAAGYLCENAGTPLTLPNLGPIGSNGLANPRHFLYPVARTENSSEPASLICKSQHHLWSATLLSTPLNVLAWHGNYAPYSYDLALFNTINTVSFDHPDPSIFTVLTSESNTPGVANLDFVIFPPRWMVAEHTFRPPYFHRNIMSEMMGLLTGMYDAKKDGFLPGGISIHNCMTPHGPDADTCRAAIRQTLTPERYENTLAFMFETKEPWIISECALASESRQHDYSDCWQNMP